MVDEEPIGILYEELVRLYNLEMEAHDTLRDKANVIIAFAGTLITIITISIIQVKFAYKIEINPVILALPYIPLTLSLLFVFRSYSIVHLYTINSQELLKNYFGEDRNTILAQLASNIASDTEENKKISFRRKKLINISLICLFIGFIFVAILIIFFYCQPMPITIINNTTY